MSEEGVFGAPDSLGDWKRACSSRILGGWVLGFSGKRVSWEESRDWDVLTVSKLGSTGARSWGVFGGLGWAFAVESLVQGLSQGLGCSVAF